MSTFRFLHAADLRRLDRRDLKILSDGTLDQLYLAFRLASFTNYSAAAQLIPIIADDALVHFDGPRTEAAMDLLSDFSATTQVLLVTHDEKICDVA